MHSAVQWLKMWRRSLPNLPQVSLRLQKEAQAELNRRKSKKLKKKKPLQQSSASPSAAAAAASASAAAIDVNGAGGGRTAGEAGGGTGGDSDDVAEAVHNGEAGDIMDDKDPKRGLWKSVKDLRRMLRLVRSFICPQEIVFPFPLHPASHSQNRPSFSRPCSAFRGIRLFQYFLWAMEGEWAPVQSRVWQGNSALSSMELPCLRASPPPPTSLAAQAVDMAQAYAFSSVPHDVILRRID